jgi:tetratricopeptide (TPR) repeat protein
VFQVVNKLLRSARGPSADELQQAIQAARQHHQAGRLADAERICQEILRARPEHPDALNLLGVIAHQDGKNLVAVELIEKAIRQQPSNPKFLNNLGEAHRGLGRLEEALASYDKALAIEPGHFGALLNRGNALQQLKRFEEAVACYDRAVAIRPDFAAAWSHRGMALQGLKRYGEAADSHRKVLALEPGLAEAHSNLGVALKDQGRLPEAIACFRQAISLKPAFAEAHCNLGIALKDQGKPDEAIACLRGALSINADFAEAHFALGAALRDRGRLDEAIAGYRSALSLRPDFFEALFALGVALKDQGRLEEAIASYQSALLLKPDFFEAHNNLGAVLGDRGRLEDAVACYRKAIFFKPDSAEAYNNLGAALGHQGKVEEAAASYRQALSCRPDFAEARWSLAMSKLPAVYGPGVAPADCRAEFEVALAELDAWFVGERVRDGYKAIGSQQPFLLAYQEENNRGLLSRYGALCARLMDDWLQRQEGLEPVATSPAGKIRLAIVSRHFYDHSVWQALIKGWLQQLDRGKFELHLFHLGATQDDETAYARRSAATFSHGKGDLRHWVEALLAQRPDVLIYPEIGMDPMVAKLASMRLAPVQLTTWGHPQTSGLPTIDYYLSGEGLEPRDAGAHYTERLVSLPNLGCSYPVMPVAATEPDLGALAIDASLPLLICPGTPFKYAPQFDHVFADIARQLGRCQFVFFAPPMTNQSDLLQQRLRTDFTRAGLRYEDYVVPIPWQEERVFNGLLRRADVYLDTIGFSGFNTAMLAVECGLPIVTREGKFMRGRLAGGILNRIGLQELVAPTEGAYVALAVRLAKDAEYRERVRARMQEAKNLLYDDPAPIRAMESFLASATSG